MYVPRSPSCVSYKAEAISLDALLQFGALEKRDRLKLDLLLSSAVIQLHSTECWGRAGESTIFCFHKSKSVNAR